ncbi:Ig-like domain-containing protein, partial [Paraburkholderia caballeronis]
MANIRVVAKETGQVVAQSGNEVRLLKPSVVTVDITPSQIQSIARDGNRIVIRLKSGETVTIENFFGPNGEATSDLVIHDNDSNGFWAVGYSDATGEFALSPIESADQLLAAQAAGDSLVPLIAFAAAGVGMGVAAGLASSGGNSSGRSPAKDNAQTGSHFDVTSNNMYGLVGTADPGTSITLTRPDGSTVTTVASDSGVWHFNPNPLSDGEQGTVTGIDPNGRPVGPLGTGVADVTPPAEPAIEHNGAGELSGSAEPGSTITLTLPDGSTVTTVTDGNGHWSFGPNPLAEGDEGTLTATDPAGNHSAPETTGPADRTPPDESQLSVDHNNQDGLSGTGTPGDTIILTLPDGTTVTTIVDENGHWEFVPNPLPEGGTGTITEVDPNGNTTGGITTGPSDQTPPDETQLSVDENNGHGLGGTGTPGDTITVERPDGTTVTTIVDENGHWEFVPNPLPDGGTGTVTETDPAGNSTGGITTGPSDQTPPDDTQLSVDENNGHGLGGTGTPGDTITVERPDGTTVTTIVDENGHWEFVPNPLPDGGTGTVTETDPAGNSTGGVTTGPSDQTPPDESQLSVDENNGHGLGGTGTPGDTITVERPDGTTVTTTVDENGHWEITPNPLPDGGTGTVTETDPAGNSTGGITTGPSDQTPPDESQLTVDENNGHGLGGTGTPGDTITVERPDGTTVTTTVDENGHWEITPNPLPDGGTGTVTETDPAGNSTGGITTGPSDQTAPPAPNVEQNNGNGLGGTGEPGDTITVERPDGSTVTTTVDDNGHWEIAPNPLPDGGSGTVTETDPAGNVSDGTTTGPSDLVPPVSTDLGSVNLVDDVGPVTGTIARGGSTDDPKPTFSGHASGDVATVNVYDNGTLIGSAAVDASGNWSFEPAEPLADGAHDFQAAPVDAAGNVGPKTADWSFTVVTDAASAPAAPAITLVTDDAGPVTGPLQKGDTTDDRTPTISGTGTAGTTVTIFVNGTAVGSQVVDDDGNWSVTVPALTGDGQKTITAQASDGAGRQSPMTGGYPIVLDTTAPTAPGVVTATDDVGSVKGPIAAGGVTDDTQPGFSGSGAEPGATVTVYDGSTVLGTTTVDASGNWAFTPAGVLANGSHAISVTLTDHAGNTSAASPALNFTINPDTTVVSIVKAVDDVGPIQGDVANNGLTDDPTPTLVGTATAGAVVTVSEGATVLGSVTADASGNWSLTLPAQTEGAHTYTATSNGAGSGSTASFTLNLDLSAPAAPGIGSVTVTDDVGVYQGSVPQNGSIDDTTPTLAGSGATPGDTINVYDNGTLVGSATVGPDGNWNYTPTTPLAEGQHNLTVSQVDPAGNESAQSAPFAVVVDTTPPGPLDGSSLTLTDDVGTITGPIARGSATDDARPTFGGRAPAGDVATVNVYDNGALIGSAAVDASGNWSFEPDLPLEAGSHSFQAAPVDAAGNEGPLTPAWSFTMAGPAPAAPAITLVTDDAGPVTGPLQKGDTTDDRTPTISGTGTVGTTVTVFVDGTAVGSATVDNDGNWSVTTPALTGDGQKTITAQASDVAGQLSPMTGGYPIVLDTTAPTAPGVVTATDDVGSVKGPIAAGGVTDDTQP